MLDAALIVLEGHLRGTSFPLGPNAVIGRALGCDIQLVHDGISRRHCEIAIHEDGATVEDLGSTNGTILNGERITTAPLYHGDKLEVGPIVFQFQCAAARNPQDTGAELAPGLAQGAEPVELSSSRIIALPPIERSAAEPAVMDVSLTSFLGLASWLAERRDAADHARGFLDRIRAMFAPDRAVLFTFDPSSDRVLPIDVRRGVGDPPGTTVPIPERVVSPCIREGKVVLAAIVEDASPPGTRSCLCAPLRTASRTIGALYLDRPTVAGVGAFTERDMEVLAGAAKLVAMALDHVAFEREARSHTLGLERRLAVAEAERDVLRGAFENADDALVAVGEDGALFSANALARVLLAQSSEEGAPVFGELARPVLRGERARHVVRWSQGSKPLQIEVWASRNEAGEVAGAVLRLSLAGSGRVETQPPVAADEGTDEAID